MADDERRRLRFLRNWYAAFGAAGTESKNKRLVHIAIKDGYIDWKGIIYSRNPNDSVHASGTSTGESLSAGPPNNAATADASCLYTVPAGTYTIHAYGGRLFVTFRDADNTVNLLTARNVNPGYPYTFSVAEPVIVYVRADLPGGITIDNDLDVELIMGG